MTTATAVDICLCGCAQPITNKSKYMSGRQKYIVGHSPHHFGKTRRIKEILPDGPRYPVEPGCCPKCQGTNLIHETVVSLIDFELRTMAWKCWRCGWRGYV